MAHNSAYQT